MEREVRSNAFYGILDWVYRAQNRSLCVVEGQVENDESGICIGRDA